MVPVPVFALRACGACRVYQASSGKYPRWARRDRRNRPSRPLRFPRLVPSGLRPLPCPPPGGGDWNRRARDASTSARGARSLGGPAAGEMPPCRSGCPPGPLLRGCAPASPPAGLCPSPVVMLAPLGPPPPRRCGSPPSRSAPPPPPPPSSPSSRPAPVSVAPALLPRPVAPRGPPWSPARCLVPRLSPRPRPAPLHPPRWGAGIADASRCVNLRAGSRSLEGLRPTRFEDWSPLSRAEG